MPIIDEEEIPQAPAPQARENVWQRIADVADMAAIPRDGLIPLGARRIDPFFIGDKWHDNVEDKEGKRGEDLFRHILEGIKEIYEVDAVIAGGAVRDLAAGINRPKDVDLWVPITSDRFWFSNQELGWGEFNGMPKKVAKGYTCVVPINERIQGRCQYVPIDLLLIDKPLDKETVDKFPVYAQRCVFTLEGGMSLSPEAKTDIENKTFTIDPKICDDKEKIGKVVEKIKGWCKRPHYKDWKIIEPDVPEWWEAKKEAENKEDNLKLKTEEAFNKYWKDMYVAGEWAIIKDE
jgi:hypothetical protein